jgi:hypothetical protein
LRKIREDSGKLRAAHLSNKKPPKVNLGGNGKPFFGRYAGSARLGSPFKASQRMTLGLVGFGGALIHFQPIKGWNKTVAPCDVRASFAVFSRSGRLVQALKNHSVAQSISSSSPK